MKSLPLVLLLLAAAPATADSITGQATIVDGDTIEILGVPVRLEGIDAPETGQTCRRPGGGEYSCGKRAVDYLRKLVGGRQVTCTGEERDRYGRLLAFCRVNGVDINRQMVLSGMAVAFLQYSDTYAMEERQARAARAGIWNGEFVRPRRYRAGEWEGAGAAGGECVIKGNINSRGEKIYHLPWSKSYRKTRINPARGERWFCSESEALAAGWRAPHR